VQKVPGDAAVALYPASDQNRAQAFAVAHRIANLKFRKPGKPRIALTDYRAKITTSRIKFRMECVGKTCCAATYRVLLPEYRF
jgi:hypothetical protein